MKGSHETLILNLTREIGKVFIGKEESIHNVLLGLFSGLHVLLEDLPGVGKTTLIKALAAVSGLDFGRIQFTPDLLPGDILGLNIWNRERSEFIYKPGAVMHQLLLADEINRASARTQAGLLEVMQEARVTVDGITRPVPQPLTVFATQNPATFAGTYQLPEAQSDRFGLSFSIGYPTEDEELRVMDRVRDQDPFSRLQAAAGPEEISACRRIVREIHVDQKIRVYLARLAGMTRKTPLLQLGMSPRAAGQMMVIAQTEAFLAGRDFVIPEDVLKTAPAALLHRLIPSAEARMNGLDTGKILDRLLAALPVPVGIP